MDTNLYSVAEGNPSNRLRRWSESKSLPKSILGRGDTFALRVKGGPCEMKGFYRGILWLF